MRRNLIAVAATFACLAAFPVVANAASVQALGTITGPVLFSVNAVSTPATGTFGSVFFISQNNNTFQIRGTVACMTVSGNEAYVVYRDTLPRPDGAGGYIRMIDNGRAGVTAVDEQNNGRFTLKGLNNQIAAGCPVPTAGSAFHPTHTLLSGEIIVVADPVV